MTDFQENLRRMAETVNRLTALHLPYSQEGHHSAALDMLTDQPAPGFWLNTCGRVAHIGVSDQPATVTLSGYAIHTATPLPAFVVTVDDVLGGEQTVHGSTFQGREVYAFLLKLASGMLSLERGDEDVFGQVLSAWRTSFEPSMAPTMQSVFADAKIIRDIIRDHMSPTRPSAEGYPPAVDKLMADMSVLAEAYAELRANGQNPISRDHMCNLVDMPQYSTKNMGIRKG